MNYMSNDKNKAGLNSYHDSKKTELKDDFNCFVRKYKDKYYEISIDKQNYAIPIILFIGVLLLNEESFLEIISNSTIKGIKKEHFIYSLLDFLAKANILNEYRFSETQLYRIERLKSYQVVDFESINEILSTDVPKINEVVINDKLRSSIYEGIPQSFDPLKKAVYIYIKMCKILSYDDEFYVERQRGKVALKHRNVSNVSTITPENNIVVCYEFNVILAKFLNELGINSEAIQGRVIYGCGHANLKFRYDKFLVKADALKSILEGDLIHAKLNQPLDGLDCLNQNEKTKREFSDMFDEVYAIINQQENKKINSQNFEDIFIKYQKLNSKTSISLEEKLNIFLSMMIQTQFSNLENLCYMLYLRKIIFSKYERSNNIVISIIRNALCDNEICGAKSTAVITINARSFFEDSSENNYYLFDDEKGFVSISINELQTLFDEGVFSYINDNDRKIPKIVESSVRRKCLPL